MKKKELHKLILDLQNRMQRLELDKALIFQPLSSFPSAKIEVICPAGGIHNYPNPWYSINPPNCTKCGQQAVDYNIVYTNDCSTSIQTDEQISTCCGKQNPCCSE